MIKNQWRIDSCILLSIIERWTESELGQSSSVKEISKELGPWQFAYC